MTGQVLSKPQILAESLSLEAGGLRADPHAAPEPAIARLHVSGEVAEGVGSGITLPGGRLLRARPHRLRERRSRFARVAHGAADAGARGLGGFGGSLASTAN